MRIHIYVIVFLFSFILPSNTFAQNASRVSDVGHDDFGNYNATHPAVAYNSHNDEFLIVWQGDDTGNGQVNDEFEIYAQRLDGKTGAELGTNDFPVSSTSSAGDADYDALHPAVVYNSTENEYFVVWSADTDAGGLVDDEYEIFAQRLNAETGAPVGSVIRISDMGPEGSANFDADYPAVAWDSNLNRYLVVWHGDDDAGGLIDDDIEVFGQLVDASDGNRVGSNFQISRTGGTSDPAFEIFYKAQYPSVAYDSSTQQYLVAYWSDDNSTVTVSNEEFEVFGRFIQPDGSRVGSDDTRIGAMGIFNLMLDYVGHPAVISNPDAGEFLVVWSGFHDTGSGVSGTTFSGYDIFGQRIRGSSRLATGADDFRISDMGGDGSDPFSAITPAGVYYPFSGEYLIYWSSDDNTQDVVNGEFEIFMQRLAASDGAEVGENDLRVSFMGPDGDTTFTADTAAVAVRESQAEALIIWSGYDNYNYGGQEIFADFVDVNYAGTLLPGFCFEWNGFLDMWNIAEYANSSSADIVLRNDLYALSGTLQSSNDYTISAGLQRDILVHDVSGWQPDSYGKVCAAHGAQPGDINGRAVFYRPNGSGYDFAFAAPFVNSSRGRQYVPFNTYQPSLDPSDAGNLAANWIQVVNDEQTSQRGTLVFYGGSGTELDRQTLTLAAGERMDVSAHQFGAGIVGLAAWLPESIHMHTRMRNVRYYYDNAGTTNSFDSAFQLAMRKTQSSIVYVPVDTREGSAVLEIINTADKDLDASVTLYTSAGAQAASENVSLSSYASQHIVVDSLLSRDVGLAVVEKENSASMNVTAMQYGRNSSAGITYVYGIPAGEPKGPSIEGSYNTFIGQGCALILGNTSSSNQTVTVSMVRYDGTTVVSGNTHQIPATGIIELNICASAQADSYGTVTITGTDADSLVGVVIRKGAGDDYRFPTEMQ